MKKKSEGISKRMTQLLKKLSDTIKKQDKNVMISLITACVFSLFGILQLIFVISTSLARTFDHISLILVDFIIAAICIVYVLYRKGKLGSFSYDTETDKKETKADKGTHPAPSDISRVCIPSEKLGNNARSVVASSGVRQAKKTSGRSAENENLFSPRHRYSDKPVQRRQPTVSGSHVQTRSSKFSSRHTGR